MILDKVGEVFDTGVDAVFDIKNLKARSRAAEIKNKERLAKLRFEDVAAEKELLKARSNFMTREGLIRLGTQALKVASVVGTIGTAAWALNLFLKGRA